MLPGVRERLRRHLDETGLIPAGTRVLVAYSGGPDSTAMLSLLHGLGFDVAAGHLHHGQRAEADTEMKLAEAFCADLGVPFLGGRADVPGMAEDLGVGLEEAGREARYGFLESARLRLQGDLVATGHTRDDLVETILLHLARGTGPAGLIGIPARRDRIVRPMLSFSRAETRAYCEAEGLWFHDDPANVDVSFSRARIRHRIVPEMREINSGFDRNVARTAMILAEEDRMLNGMAAAALEQSETPLDGPLRFLTLDCEIAFDRARLTSIPAPLFKRAIRLAVGALGGVLDSTQTDRIASGAAEEPNGAVTGERGRVVVEWTPERVSIRSAEEPPAFQHALVAPGETASQEFGWRLEALVASSPHAFQRRDLAVGLDIDRIVGDLSFRSVEPGDSMHPMGFSGRRKLSDLLSEAKLTRAARRRLPIICDSEGPIWAPGVCVDARVAASPDSRNVLLVRMSPLRRAEGHNGGNVAPASSVTPI